MKKRGWGQYDLKHFKHTIQVWISGHQIEEILFVSNCWSSLNRIFSADEDQGGIFFSEDFLESYGDSWGCADMGC